LACHPGISPFPALKVTNCQWVGASGELDREGRRHAALKRVGIELSGHGYMPDSEIGGYVLHIYETSVQPLDPAYAVDFASLEHRRVEEEWDGRLDQAMSALQITCTQPAGWLLVASYT
ncbi:hypothetical protein, partial [Mycobacteroides abscessus]|uniref:hypothetical protein n=1 Tax=Mycobacteroides abscessus TaxID=36809 RepID=UPI000ACA2C68